MDDVAKCCQCGTPLPDEDPQNRSKCPNCGSFQRSYSAHVEEAIKPKDRLDEPPLSPDERQRRVLRLCCSFMRNLAFHRAGLDIEVQRKLFDPRCAQAAFWLEVHGNFFDISVLDWCKLFADRKGKHHWRRVVEDPDRFEADLYTTLGVTADEFTTLITKINHYRNKFVAHLDEEQTMLLPALEVARRAIVFLHERLAQEVRTYEDWQGLHATAEQLDRGFTQAFQEAQRVYLKL
jgi:hypothetical protein